MRSPMGYHTRLGMVHYGTGTGIILENINTRVHTCFNVLLFHFNEVLVLGYYTVYLIFIVLLPGLHMSQEDTSVRCVLK